MMKTISICNQKGGVGKTTSAVNIAYGLHLSSKSTLLIDLDPQTNASSYLGNRDSDPNNCSFSVLQKPSRIKDSIVKVKKNLDIIPASLNYLEDPGPRDGENAYLRLVEAFEFLPNAYDYIIIDCPPSLGSYTYNAISVSSEIIIPVQAHYLSLEGLIQIVNLVKEISAIKDLSFRILISMFEETQELSIEILKEIKQHFNENRFSIAIPFDIALAESPSHEKSIFEYAPVSAGAIAYAKVVKEIIHGK